MADVDSSQPPEPNNSNSNNDNHNGKASSRLSRKRPNPLHLLSGSRHLPDSSPSTVSSRNQSDERADLPVNHDVPEPPQSARTGNVVDQPIQEEKESSSTDEDTDHSVTGDAPLHSATPASRRTSMPGTSTPPTGRRSVQFARNTSDNELQEPSRSRASSIGPDDADPASKDRKQSLFTKLKAFAAAPSFPSHSRSASLATVGGGLNDHRNTGDLQTPGSEREEFRFPGGLEEEGSEVDADAEESAGEQRIRLRRRRKKKQPQRTYADSSEPQTAPATPRASTRPALFSSNSFTPLGHHRPSVFPRRATSDFHQQRDGVSEDEGRNRLKMDTTWRRRSSAWLSSARGLTYSGRQESQNAHEEKRVSNFRRLAALAGPSENSEGIGVSWRRHRTERGSSLSAQKWRQIKAGLKMIGQRRKVENTVDHVKSAELLAELTSGIPAALILASMFQRDEHGSRRIPILLEQLKVQITDSRIDAHSSDRHPVFRIELEYGSGMTRMKWVVHRTLKDFANLHLKYKLHIGAQKYIQLKNPETGQGLPRFPRSAFPYLRGVRGLDSDRDDDDDDGGGYETGAEATSGNEKGRKTKKRRSSIAISRRRSSVGNAQEGDAAPSEGGSGAAGTGTGKKESYSERQRKKLENYLQKLIRFLIFRPDSNRLCKFLELSALGVRLAAEGSYHGKEGFLIIQSSKGLDFRKALSPSLIKKRYSPKWFLVRHSYVVCVDSPEEMNIYDVFLVDPYFKIHTQKVRVRNQKAKDLAKSAKESATHPQHHAFKLENSERKLRLLARNERQLQQFVDSIRFMVENTPWSKPNRFDSFAPVRQRCFAQWLVDGRDHMWLVSRAINQAKDVIYIHDWWLSPELYMRRPAAISQKWRLDRLLQRKAREGVKIFVIMYRNINSAIPIDSEYSKFSLLDLHPNIFVQRSPNQFRQNTFFWAHHEKLCIVDHTLAFVGGIDLCFGRWDTPQHPVTDDKPTGFETSDMPKDADHCQLWPGKDYSNPRVQDFYDLDKPYEEMYDRNVIPRMPWHDISMHVVGQPARDLTRHFVQRWNYILRQRKPTRPTPFLLPPPDFNQADLEALGLDGTCEVQILRSSSMWSTGTPDVTEHSIMNAYVKLIEQSEHFVYIENQFFISTCEIDGKRIENLIGDALVERIIRAARNEEAWRAVILVPLMPGFQNTVDSEGGTSVRLIMQCQYRSICRGETSIFGRLRAQGIEPEDYIHFFSLRQWGKIGPQKQLVTEQLYIHAKCMIVDDRAVIIGSANINERSMLGSRDSECAAIVRDTDMLWSTMNGKPYLVGRFPHTLRMRLMREHIGIDVDEILEQDIATEAELRRRESERNDIESVMREKQDEREMIERRHRIQDEFITRSEDMHSFNHDVDWEQSNNPNLRTTRKLTADPRVTDNPGHKKDVDGEGADKMNTIIEAGLGNGRDSVVRNDNTEVIVSDIAPEGKGTISKPKKTQRNRRQKSTEREGAKERLLPPAPVGPETSVNSEEQQASEAGIASKEQTGSSQSSHPLAAELKRPVVDANCMKDPVDDAFYHDIWLTIAENNTKIYRTVFRCMPDNEVKSWKEYKEYTAYGEKFAEMQSHHVDQEQAHSGTKSQSGSPGASTAPADQQRHVQDAEKPTADSSSPDEKSQNGAADTNVSGADINRNKAGKETQSPLDEKRALKGTDSGSSNSPQDGENDGAPEDSEKTGEKDRSGPQSVGYSDAVNVNASSQQHKRRRRATTRGSKREFSALDGVIDKRQAEELLNMIQGHLVIWPYDW
ncbi:Phospholipase D [Rasamsonia emersonii CBS 393.64]|uniref:Phospholipase n=1 Tax=Rasamsonia emersonii (strain ATCC 16479 / CBS 393.64 / IMI 116815) TaxID=1408163 RepID=A0A0F4Z5F1_RASE3|nr:Phospholipase D [Rasamsonia emersonii CBS 393.64]KKA25754.1 Phospholipase D [Rasamsonia emersonii CBS 393.64]